MRYLIQGSASHLPLADESVQCVVTSPPYWGLRQYAGEQREVWGGDDSHAHEWALVERIARHSDDGVSGSTLQGGKGTQAQAQRGAMPSEGFCACGAWYGGLGLEPTPELYVEHMVAIFREVRRVLRPDGTLWLNLGDSYAGNRGNTAEKPGHDNLAAGPGADLAIGISKLAPGLKPKDLVGIPWRVAFALQADGWYLRSDIIWHKPNPMPESVTDRPTKAHEYLFLLAKSERYFYDADAIREHMSDATATRLAQPYLDTQEGGYKTEAYQANHPGRKQRDRRPADVLRHMRDNSLSGRNKRTVWTIPTRPYPGAHFATYPEQLVEPCILAGTSPKACGVCGAPWEREIDRVGGQTTGRTARQIADGAERGIDRASYPSGALNDVTSQHVTLGWRSTCEHQDDSGACVVLDPFNGSGTTGRVALRYGRRYAGIDISHEYLHEQATRRIDNIQQEMPL